MCRFFTYSGPAILMQDLLVDACNSLVQQSKSAKKTHLPVNGDGFGLGWYPLHNDPEPGTFVSVEPAWRNKNLRQLASKIKAKHFFAHVRDASGGLAVNLQNCHPFQYKNLLWMHNGWLDGFELIKRKLIAELDDPAYQLIEGSTDSEHAFALFMQQVKMASNISRSTMVEALLATMQRIMQLRKQANINNNAFMNFAVTNGVDTIATRFSSDEQVQPSSLFYAQGKLVRCRAGELCLIQPESPEENSIIIASEPLTKDRPSWIKVERNHMVIARGNESVEMLPIPLPFQKSL
ncbi:class II glutamine amidotransferase [Saccharobesus litoralis]|uniref:Class II glutamine amidotransferase n=1 Tax=Saccharobesus litoralis TaxID=2172099 RepID=A0A2S0VSD5_9ALTE|nr:class II glutamine amidotransferase [Saccharobesus litoralis]AWB67131.1 class II glutamine amidotransferase [Saccharobesus litoralis]